MKILCKFLRKFDLQRLETNYCIFVSRDLIVAIYIDDLLIIVNDKKVYKNLKSQFETEFKMTDMSLANHYLDIELHQNVNSIIIKQTEFIKKILHQFDMKNAVLKLTSMNDKICLDSEFA